MNYGHIARDNLYHIPDEENDKSLCGYNILVMDTSPMKKANYCPTCIGLFQFVMWRDHQGAHVNIPQAVIYHSPTGFEWNYGGSGPADLALNILENALKRSGFEGERMLCWKDTTCFCRAMRLHQEFKVRFIEPMPYEGGSIPLADVLAFIKERTG